MSEQPVQLPLPGFEGAMAEWRRDYDGRIAREEPLRNRSGIEIKPLRRLA